MRHLHYGDTKPGDVLIVNVPVVLRITSKGESSLAPGMRAFHAEVLDAPGRVRFDCGTLVDAYVYDTRDEALDALDAHRDVIPKGR